MLLRILFTFFLFNLGSIEAYYPQDFNNELTKIAFGSCNRVDRPMPMWDPILQSNPDLWIWTGDIVYADTEDMHHMQQKYDRLFFHSAYQEFRQSLPIIGVWDDHDFGVNDGGREYPQKENSQQLLLNFLEEPMDSPRRDQQGVYTSYIFGQGERTVKIIILDTRYHREKPGKQADILGNEQWAWLENEIYSTTAPINIIVSSIQVLNYQRVRGEQWHNFPKAKKRLLDLIKNSKLPGAILVTGDKHFGAIEKARRTKPPLYDIMSSGLTHVISGRPKVYASLYYRGKLLTELNFGMIVIDWESDPIQIKLQIRDSENNVRLERIMSL